MPPSSEYNYEQLVVVVVADNSGMSSMKDEDGLQQQQQQADSSPTDTGLPEWKSSDPYLASILRHLRATDQCLDGTSMMSSVTSPADRSNKYECTNGSGSQELADSVSGSAIRRPLSAVNAVRSTGVDS